LSTYKRKQYWIDSPLQLQMLFYVLILVTTSLGLLSYSALHGLTEAASAEDRRFFFTIEWVHNAIRAPMILASCLSILASGIVTLLWSHRYAGPLRVLSAAASRMRDGDFSTAPRVRKTDTHQELVSELAEMHDGVKALIKKDIHKAHDAAKKLEHLAEKHPSPELDAAIEELKKIGHGFKL